MIGINWYRGALCGHPLPAMANNWTRGVVRRRTTHNNVMSSPRHTCCLPWLSNRDEAVKLRQNLRHRSTFRFSLIGNVSCFFLPTDGIGLLVTVEWFLTPLICSLRSRINSSLHHIAASIQAINDQTWYAKGRHVWIFQGIYTFHLSLWGWLAFQLPIAALHLTVFFAGLSSTLQEVCEVDEAYKA